MDTATQASGFDPGDRTYPYWDDNINSLVFSHHGDMMVSVSPMMFNDRILLTERMDYPLAYVKGWCYDKGPAAGLAALAWNPTTDPEPVGYKKVAGA